MGNSELESQKIILVVTDNCRDQVNGVVTTFKNLEAMARLDGFSFVYIDPFQFPHVSCPGYKEVKLSWPSGIGSIIQEISPRHIHIATEGPIGLAAKLWCDKNFVRYSTSYHTKFPEFLNTLYKIPEKWTYKYLEWFHRKSHRVLTTTNSMVQTLKDNGFGSNVVPWIRGTNPSTLTSKRIKNPSPVLLSVGRISKEKNLDALIKLQDKYVIVVVGDGPYKPELEKKLHKAIFVGYKHGPELEYFYKQADVFVFTSKTDTFGLVMIEAMAQGTPVAGFPVQGPLDVVQNGVNGYTDEDLEVSIKKCLKLNRNKVMASSAMWSWSECWEIFKKNLTKI